MNSSCPPNLFDDEGVLTVAVRQPEQHRAALPARGRHGGALPRGRLRRSTSRAAWASSSAGWRCWRPSGWPRPASCRSRWRRSSRSACCSMVVLQRHDGQRGRGGHRSATTTPSTAPTAATRLDVVVIPVFKGAAQGDQPGARISRRWTRLSTGRSITWAQLGLAFAQIVLLLGGIFAAGRHRRSSPGANWPRPREPNDMNPRARQKLLLLVAGRASCWSARPVRAASR